MQDVIEDKMKDLKNERKAPPVASARLDNRDISEVEEM
jgi:hypothetical protein